MQINTYTIRNVGFLKGGWWKSFLNLTVSLSQDKSRL